MPYERQDFQQDCLNYLLGPTTYIEPEILCQALPLALQIKSREARFSAISIILNKGVTGPELHLALQHLIGEDGQKDDKLIELLLHNGASINYNGVDGKNCVEMATANGDSE